jgi:ethanolamine kinase
VQLLHNAGYAPRLYATFCNGLAYEYVPGVILNTTSCRDPDVFPLVARMMAHMHRVDGGDDVPKEPSIWLKIQQFLDIMPQRFEGAEKQARYQFSVGQTFYVILGSSGHEYEDCIDIA